MAKLYYTVCAYDRDAGAWFDVFGTYDKKEAQEEHAEQKASVPYARASRYVVTIQNDGTAQDMIAKRDALPKP